LTLDHTNNSMNCSWCHQHWTTAKQDYGDEGRVYRVMCREGIIEE